MKPVLKRSRQRLLEYDSLRHRLWIGGQRLHHGATGTLVAALACLGLLNGQAKGQQSPRSMMAIALTGGALMAHDWKDRSLWFRPGRGPQP